MNGLEESDNQVIRSTDTKILLEWYDHNINDLNNLDCSMEREDWLQWTNAIRDELDRRNA